MTSALPNHDGLSCRIFFKHEDPDLLAVVKQLRHLVFAVEQHLPPFVIGDHLDETALHVALVRDATLAVVASLRIVDAKDARSASIGGRHAKIERVVVAAEERGTGLGKLVMQVALDGARQRGFHGAVLDSETYANGFYEKLGFRTEGSEFMKVGLPHYIMRLAF